MNWRWIHHSRRMWALNMARELIRLRICRVVLRSCVLHHSERCWECALNDSTGLPLEFTEGA